MIRHILFWNFTEKVKIAHSEKQSLEFLQRSVATMNGHIEGLIRAEIGANTAGGYDLVFVARGMTPKLKSWQLSSVVAKLFAQAGLPDKAKRPDAPPPATVPPARRAQAEKPNA